MKKIFMLLFSTAVLSTAFAQNNHREYDDRNNQTVFQKDHDREDWKNNNNNSVYQRDQQIQRISREYDLRIQQVSFERMSRRQKRFAIESLQSQKAMEINRVMNEYNSRAYNNHDRGYDRRYSNNR